MRTNQVFVMLLVIGVVGLLVEVTGGHALVIVAVGATAVWLLMRGH